MCIRDRSTVRTPVQTKRPGSPAMAGEPPTDRSQDTIAALKFHSRAPSATRREADTTMFSFRSNAGEDVQAFSLRQQIQKEIMKRRREQLNDERSSAEPTVSYGAPVSNVYLRRFIEDFASKTHSKVEISLDRTAVSKIQLVSGAPQASTSKKAGFSRLSRAEKPSVVLEETRAKTEKKGNENPLSHLRAEKILGTGTYAVVRMMVDRREGHRFAVKTYDKAKLGDPRKLKNVQREIEVLRLLDHPNVVKLVGDHETPKQIHLIMELKGQTSLYTYLKGQPGRRLPEKEARIIFRQIVEGLSYCHDQDVIHRDLKLENVVLDEANNVKLIDFGFSICIPPTKLLNIFCGTPSYMAPEIISKTPYKGKPTDVWAAGILLFTLLCGSFPFKGSNDQELFKRIQRGKFEMPQHLGPQVSSLLTRLLQVCPRDRIEAKDLLKDTWLNEN
eukprot:TRINITY_DN683_c0_g2_i1.p1 TRINITY_DN683_c0_g2~~TRINITY_DN683_c0_g2_i1.p1  ORF type:complete len:445 (+),score=96.60 TRINITY_DN683_c0_g2_i1:63-1397(+)